MTFKSDWKEFSNVFGGVMKLILVSIPALLVPIANVISGAFGGSEFIPLGQYRAFAAALAPVVSSVAVFALFGQRHALGQMLSHDEHHAGGRRPALSRSAVLFLTLPVTLFGWGVSGLFLILVQVLGSSGFQAVVYILSFMFMTLAVALFSMREFLEDRMGRVRSRGNRHPRVP